MRKTHRRRAMPIWDLFQPAPQTPGWTEFPQPVQCRVRELLARLLREERESEEVHGPAKEDGHE
jgi:hypothetical protein